MNKLTFIFGIMVVFSVSCGTKKEENGEVIDEQLSEQEQQQQIYDEVMGLHDELMPKMKDIFDLRSEILEKADSLEGIGKSSDDLMQKISDLEAGEEAMMDWMRNFQSLPEQTPHDSIMSYMILQREKIMAVQEKIKQVMEAGRSAINN